MMKIKISVLILALAIVVVQGTWIFLNARKRGEKYYWLWGLLGLTNFPSALIVYLIVMGVTHEKCTHCGREIKKGIKSCPYCGDTLRESCPKCGKNIEMDWEYCPECNNKLKGE